MAYITIALGAELQCHGPHGENIFKANKGGAVVSFLYSGQFVFSGHTNFTHNLVIFGAGAIFLVDS